MSAGQFRGQTVNLGACLCSPLQILAAMNNNIASFFQWIVNNGGTPANDQAGTTDLAINDTSKAVVFPTPFAAVPTVVAVLVAPDNTGFVIGVSVDQSTVTATGFTALFGAAIPDAGYKLNWIAIPKT